MKKNTVVFWGQYPGNFETKFFPLRFEGILYNSVVLTFTFAPLSFAFILQDPVNCGLIFAVAYAKNNHELLDLK